MLRELQALVHSCADGIEGSHGHGRQRQSGTCHELAASELSF